MACGAMSAVRFLHGNPGDFTTARRACKSPVFGALSSDSSGGPWVIGLPPSDEPPAGAMDGEVSSKPSAVKVKIEAGPEVIEISDDSSPDATPEMPEVQQPKADMVAGPPKKAARRSAVEIAAERAEKAMRAAERAKAADEKAQQAAAKAMAKAAAKPAKAEREKAVNDTPKAPSFKERWNEKETDPLIKWAEDNHEDESNYTRETVLAKMRDVLDKSEGEYKFTEDTLISQFYKMIAVLWKDKEGEVDKTQHDLYMLSRKKTSAPKRKAQPKRDPVGDDTAAEATGDAPAPVSAGQASFAEKVAKFTAHAKRPRGSDSDEDTASVARRAVDDGELAKAKALLKSHSFTDDDMSTLAKLSSRFKTWSLAHHPDKLPDEKKAAANEVFKDVNIAKGVLNNHLAMFGAFNAMFGTTKRKRADGAAAPPRVRVVATEPLELTPEQLFAELVQTMIRVLKENNEQNPLIDMYRQMVFSNQNLAGLFDMLRRKDKEFHGGQAYAYDTDNKGQLLVPKEAFDTMVSKVRAGDYAGIEALYAVFSHEYFHPVTGGAATVPEVDKGENVREYEVDEELKKKREQRAQQNPLAPVLDEALMRVDDSKGEPCLNANQLRSKASEEEDGYEKQMLEDAAKVLTSYDAVYVKLPYPYFSSEKWKYVMDLQNFRFAKWSGSWDYNNYSGRLVGFDPVRKAFRCELEEAYDGPTTDRKVLFFDLRVQEVAKAERVWGEWLATWHKTVFLEKETKAWDTELVSRLDELYEEWAALAAISPMVVVVDSMNRPVIGNADLESIECFDFMNYGDVEIVEHAAPAFETDPKGKTLKLNPDDTKVWKELIELSKKYTTLVQRDFIEQGWKQSIEMAINDARTMISKTTVSLLCHDLMTAGEWRQRFGDVQKPDNALHQTAFKAIGLVRSCREEQTSTTRLKAALRPTATKRAEQLWKEINSFLTRQSNLITDSTNMSAAIDELDKYHTNLAAFIRVQETVIKQKLNTMQSSAGYIPGNPMETQNDEEEEVEDDDERWERNQANTPDVLHAASSFRKLQALDMLVANAKDDVVDTPGSSCDDRSALANAEAAYKAALHAFTVKELRDMLAHPRFHQLTTDTDSRADLELRVHELVTRKRDDDSEADSEPDADSDSDSESDSAEKNNSSVADECDDVCDEMQQIEDALKTGRGLQEVAKFVQNWLVLAYPSIDFRTNMLSEARTDAARAARPRVLLYRQCYSLMANAANRRRHEAYFEQFAYIWRLQHDIIPAAEEVAFTVGSTGPGNTGWEHHMIDIRDIDRQTQRDTIKFAVTVLVETLKAELDDKSPASLAYFVRDADGVTARLRIQGETDPFTKKVTKEDNANLLQFIAEKGANPALLPAPKRRQAPRQQALIEAAAPQTS